MNRKSRIRSLTGLVGMASIVALSLAGCSSSTDTDGSATQLEGGGQSIKVGFSSPIAANPYIYTTELASQAIVENAGGEFISRDADLDPNQQVTDLEYFISAEVDAIIIPFPLVLETVTPILQDAQAAGIAVITQDAVMSYDDDSSLPAGVDAQVIDDRRDAAEQQVAFLEERVPDGGEVLFVSGPVPSPAIISSEEEFITALEGSVFELAGVVNNMTDDIAGAKPLVDAALTGNPNIVAVVAYNDPSALGAAQSGADAQRDLVTVGLQGMPEVIDAIRAGTVSATVDLSAVEAGQLMGELAIKAANDEEGWQKNYILAATLLHEGNIDQFVSWEDQLAAL